LRAANFSRVETRAEAGSKGHSPISSSVRRQPAQKPDRSIVQTPVQGLGMAAWTAQGGGVIFLKD
jgi:hypothetical protein